MHEEHTEEQELTYNEWGIPSVEVEMGEIERTARVLSPDNAPTQLEHILEAFESGMCVVLDDDMWARLENSDSWDVRPGHMEDAVGFAEESGRDAVKFEKSMRDNIPIPMPLIVIKKDGTPYKVAGNTRLMVARALGITPKVFVARL